MPLTGFYKFDVEMIHKAKEVINELQHDIDLDVAGRNEMQFIARYFDGLEKRIQQNLEAGL